MGDFRAIDQVHTLISPSCHHCHKEYGWPSLTVTRSHFSNSLYTCQILSRLKIHLQSKFLIKKHYFDGYGSIMSTISKCALFSYKSVFVFITITRIPGFFRISVYALNLQNVIYCQSSICCFNQISLIDGSRQWNSETLEFSIYLIELHSSWFAAGAGRFEQKAALVSLVLSSFTL